MKNNNFLIVVGQLSLLVGFIGFFSELLIF